MRDHGPAQTTRKKNLRNHSANTQSVNKFCSSFLPAQRENRGKLIAPLVDLRLQTYSVFHTFCSPKPTSFVLFLHLSLLCGSFTRAVGCVCFPSAPLSPNPTLSLFSCVDVKGQEPPPVLSSGSTFSLSHFARFVRGATSRSRSPRTESQTTFQSRPTNPHRYIQTYYVRPSATSPFKSASLPSPPTSPPREGTPPLSTEPNQCL